MPLDVNIAAWNTLLDEGENWTALEGRSAMFSGPRVSDRSSRSGESRVTPRGEWL
jgi:hypothetical protein